MARARQKANPRQTVFVVQHGDVAERVFTDRAAAEAHRLELERSVRTWANPLASGKPETLSSGGLPKFMQAIRAMGLPSRVAGESWGEWWDHVYPEMRPEQRDAVWNLLDKLHYFVVVEVPLED